MHRFKSLLLILFLALLTLPVCKQRKSGSIKEAFIGKNNPDRLTWYQKNTQQLQLNILKMTNALDGQRLTIDSQKDPWSSSFWSKWKGGVAARWKKGTVYNYLGYKVPSRQDILKELVRQKGGNSQAEKYIKELSPIEKYDLLVGDYNFSATIVERILRGKDHPEWGEHWEGFCNGISAASISVEEPHQEFTLVNPDGFLITFYPNDIKALLGLSYFQLDDLTVMGGRCHDEHPKLDKQGRPVELSCRDINAGSLLITMFNRLVMKKSPFIMETDRKNPVWNYPVTEGKISLLPPPTNSSRIQVKQDLQERWTEISQLPLWNSVYDYDSHNYQHAAENTRYLLNVEMEVDLRKQSSHEDSNQKEASHELQYQSATKTSFKQIYQATIELDPELNIIGGEWINGPSSHNPVAPDFLWYPGTPAIDRDNYLKANPYVHLNLLQILHDLSTGKRQKKPAPYRMLEYRMEWGEAYTSSHPWTREVPFDDQLKILNLQFTPGNMLHLAGTLHFTGASYAQKAILFQDSGSGIATFPVHQKSFHLEEFFFFEPSAPMQIAFLDQKENVLYQTAPIPIKPSMQYSPPPPKIINMYYDQYWTRKGEKKLNAVYQFWYPVKKELAPQFVQVDFQSIDKHGKIVSLYQSKSYHIIPREDFHYNFSIQGDFPKEVFRLSFNFYRQLGDTMGEERIWRDEKPFYAWLDLDLDFKTYQADGIAWVDNKAVRLSEDVLQSLKRKGITQQFLEGVANEKWKVQDGKVILTMEYAGHQILYHAQITPLTEDELLYTFNRFD